jgi:hypothetical protein
LTCIRTKIIELISKVNYSILKTFFLKKILNQVLGDESSTTSVFKVPVQPKVETTTLPGGFKVPIQVKQSDITLNCGEFGFGFGDTNQTNAFEIFSPNYDGVHAYWRWERLVVQLFKVFID